MNNTWTTRDGTILHLSEMTPRHLMNCLRMRLRQFINLQHSINEQVYDFTLDFGYDGEMGIAIGLCKEEYKQLDKYDSDVTMLKKELERRNYIVNDDGHILMNNRIVFSLL